MHVVQTTEKLLHEDCGHVLAENLVVLLGNLFEQLTAVNIFHNQVDILVINIRLIILHNIGVVKLCEDGNLFLNGI
jgi:hypothetical protein